MFAKLDEVVAHYRELEQKLADPEIASDHEAYTTISKEHAPLRELVDTYDRHRKLEAELESTNELLKTETDEEMKEMAREEQTELKERIDESEQQLKLLLLPKDPNDEKDIFLEIRAGAGGDEAGLFAADLFRMYAKYAESRRWKTEIVTSHPTGIGGMKEIVAQINGSMVYSKLKYESGVHRVQRVPETEAQGRIHTSTVTVAVMPEAGEVDVAIEDKDLKIDRYRSSGPGGQSVNTTDSAIRITHLPTGLVVICQDERSQHKNKAKALKVLRAMLFEKELRRQQDEQAANRRQQVGTGDRAEKIRTYNFPQGRITDHRVGLTIYRLTEVLDGDVDRLVDPLHAHFQAEALKQTEQ